MLCGNWFEHIQEKNYICPKFYTYRKNCSYMSKTNLYWIYSKENMYIENFLDIYRKKFIYVQN